MNGSRTFQLLQLGPEHNVDGLVQGKQTIGELQMNDVFVNVFLLQKHN